MPADYLGHQSGTSNRPGAWHDNDETDLDEQLMMNEHELHMNDENRRQGVSEAHQDEERIEEEMYSDDGSSTASIPDEDIDFSLTYALHTFVATVEGQASVVKGDSLVLLDDANSYWWLVRVLKTEDVGYIPAENIETPFERLARLNKHRNVDLASATPEETLQDPVQSRQAIQRIAGRQTIASLARSGSRPSLANGDSWEDHDSPVVGGGSDGDHRERKVMFAAPTYVDHPGVTWSETSEDEDGEDEDAATDEEGAHDTDTVEDVTQDQEGSGRDHLVASRRGGDVHTVMSSGKDAVDEMEPDDGVAWDESVAAQQQRRLQAESLARQRQQEASGRSELQLPGTGTANQHDDSQAASSTVVKSSGSRDNLLDPADLQDSEPRRITVTPAVARAGGSVSQGPLGDFRGPPHQTQLQAQRSASAASAASSTFSTVSLGTTASGHSMSSAQESVGDDDDLSGKKTKRTLKNEKKLRKSEESANEDGSKKRKSSGGVFSGLFKKKEKKDKGLRGGPGSDGTPPRATTFSNDSDSFLGRSSDDSTQIGVHDSPGSAGMGRPGQSMQARATPRPAPLTSPESTLNGGSSPAPSLSPHGLRLQQIDQRQQRLYQQYMARSPSTDAIEPASRSFGTQAAATVAQSTAAARLAIATQTNGRPGSIVLSSNPNSAGPLLNVLRVFAGEHVESESSFKTVLLSESTTARDLVKQACQRFRIAHPSESQLDLDDYFLTIKEVDGEELSLEPDSKPLEAFNNMCARIGEEDAAFLANTVKRSSVGSISSIASNLSQNPAIARLGMNDFSDDSNVKLFLNRRPQNSTLSSAFQSYTSQLNNVPEGLEASNVDGVPGIEVAAALDNIPTLDGIAERPVNRVHQSLSVSTVSTGGTGSPERIQSPSARFTLQMMVFPDDLPDGMVFDTVSEAIVPRSVLRDRAERRGGPNASVSSTERRKLLVLPRNTTVAEAIEAALERYGIVEGVVDGGDEVEDKAAARRHVQKVRYGLIARDPHDGTERPLPASQKLLEAYRIPPRTKVVDRLSGDMRRRSRDFSSSGASADIQSSDPVFILRRMGAKNLANGVQIPLDDVALRQRRLSDSNKLSSPSLPAEMDGRSRQEIIAAQRAASRATQLAILSAQANNSQGVDVVLADKGTIRSSRSLTDGGEHVRYSYISQDGETYDISQLIQDEWGTERTEDKEEVLSQPGMNRTTTETSIYRTAPSTPSDAPRDTPPLERTISRLSASSTNDLLQGAVQQARAEPNSNVVEKLDRVLSKVKSRDLSVAVPSTRASERIAAPESPGETSGPSSSQDSDNNHRPGVYHGSPREISLSPVLEDIPANIKKAVEEAPSRSNSRQLASPSYDSTMRSSSRQSVPSARLSSRHGQQPSIASVISDFSAAETETGLTTPQTGQTSNNPTPPMGPFSFSPRPNSASPTPGQPIRYKDDFGMTRMMGVIRARAARQRPPPVQAQELDSVQRMLFGEHIDMRNLHPEVRRIYEPLSHKLDMLDKEIDELLSGLTSISHKTA